MQKITIAIVLLSLSHNISADTVSYSFHGVVDNIFTLSSTPADKVFDTFNVGDTFTYNLKYETADYQGIDTIGTEAYRYQLVEYSFRYSNGYEGHATDGELTVWNNVPTGTLNESTDALFVYTWPDGHPYEPTQPSDLDAPNIGDSVLLTSNMLVRDRIDASLFESLDLSPLSDEFGDYDGSLFQLVFQDSGTNDAYINGRMTDISAVPLPAAAWLFGSALLGLGVIKRRKVA